MITIPINTGTLEGYSTFLKCKTLPFYKVEGDTILTDQESYNLVFKVNQKNDLQIENTFAFDYQTHVVNTALDRKRYAAFLDCGLGKALITLLWAQAVSQKGKALLLCPLSVINEFLNDHKKFNIQTPITNLRETNGKWSEGIGIWNYENIRDLDLRGVSGIALDESSVLKNGDGVTKKWLCKLSSLIEYKLACSATPAPNEQSEYASHAVFLGVSNTNKEFYSRFFRKQGNNWILKQHAQKAFYQNLATWSCYIHNPTLLGFECGGYLSEQPEYIVKPLPGHVDLDQGLLFSATAGLKEASKVYRYRYDTNTERFKYCVEQATNYRSIVWCNRNAEETAFAKAIPNSRLITGSTPIEKRVEYIEAFRRGDINTLISKPKILGWGVNLQQAEAHVYSGYDFSFEALYQAVRRSHRYGRKGRLKVFIPMIEAERPIYETIRVKMSTFEQDVIRLQKQFGLSK